jgi:hypothetical protein
MRFELGRTNITQFRRFFGSISDEIPLRLKAGMLGAGLLWWKKLLKSAWFSISLIEFICNGWAHLSPKDVTVR